MTHTSERPAKLYLQLYYLLAYVGFGTIVPYVSLFLKWKGFSGTEIGLIFAISSFVSIIAQPLFGFLNDRAKDYRSFLKLSAILSPLFFWGYYTSSNLTFVVITAIAISIIQSPATPILDSVSIVFGRKESFSYGQIRLWGALGWAIATCFSTFLYGSYGFGLSFYLYTIVSLIGFFVLLKFPRQEIHFQSRAIGWKHIKDVVANRHFLAFVSVSFLLMLTSAIHTNFFPLYYSSHHYPLNLLGLNYTAAAFVEVPFFLLSGYLIRRFRVLHLLSFSALLAALKFFILIYYPSLWIVYVDQMLDGISFAFYASASVELVDQFSTKETKATSQTIYAAVTGALSSIIGNLIGGSLFDSLGPTALYACISVVAALSCILYYILDLVFDHKPASLHVTSNM